MRFPRLPSFTPFLRSHMSSWVDGRTATGKAIRCQPRLAHRCLCDPESPSSLSVCHCDPNLGVILTRESLGWCGLSYSLCLAGERPTKPNWQTQLGTTKRLSAQPLGSLLSAGTQRPDNRPVVLLQLQTSFPTLQWVSGFVLLTIVLWASVGTFKTTLKAVW